MQSSDRTAFAKLMTGLAELYEKEITETGLEIWWGAMDRFDFQDVKMAMNVHVRDSGRGQFMPKPADVIRAIEGTVEDRALAAWPLVESGIRGNYQYQANHVVFDDPIIHMVIADMGSFSQLGRGPESELPFVQRDFLQRYAMRTRHPRDDYPRKIESGDYPSDQKPDVALIGNRDRAEAILLGEDRMKLVGRDHESW